MQNCFIQFSTKWYCRLFIALAQFVAFAAHAEISYEQEVADCRKISSFAAAGDKYYKLNEYAKARAQYEQQAAWSESCQLSEQKITTAYNNVALTYIHEKNYLKARAWLGIAANDKKSVFNLNKINSQIEAAITQQSGTVEGQYWQYAGKSLWNIFSIKQKEQQYEFSFDGYYAGLMAMYYGPNMGSFSALLPVNNATARYNMAEASDGDFDCIYHFTITDAELIVEREAGTSCGFGHNVSAEGTYLKVEF
ncbi:hypothetical protein [Rheinheimera sp.]|uniref:hypothetical protein n=1 Tax=Rheinheimera sp. TaxID=1869214 RepID=UPI0027362C81|nr:hypothetical protein [Rheinheimera sp.]MDP2713429.1 hypothetical protein [Rheinheimera sp.]